MDHEWSQTNLFVILCGSSMSYMENEVLSSRSPLFGRRTAQLKVEAMTYFDIARFHPVMSNEDNTLIYAITGGIPITLMNLGIMERKEPIIDGNRRKAHYIIKDQFFRFWYRFVPGNLSSILSGTFPRFYDPIVGSYLNQYMGLTFEEM